MIRREEIGVPFLFADSLKLDQQHLSVAPGEWIWTYGMLVLLGVVLVAVPAGRQLGIDQWLAPRLRADTPLSRWRRFFGWFV